MLGAPYCCQPYDPTSPSSARALASYASAAAISAASSVPCCSSENEPTWSSPWGPHHACIISAVPLVVVKTPRDAQSLRDTLSPSLPSAGRAAGCARRRRCASRSTVSSASCAASRRGTYPMVPAAERSSGDDAGAIRARPAPRAARPSERAADAPCDDAASDGRTHIAARGVRRRRAGVRGRTRSNGREGESPRSWSRGKSESDRDGEDEFIIQLNLLTSVAPLLITVHYSHWL